MNHNLIDFRQIRHKRRATIIKKIHIFSTPDDPHSNGYQNSKFVSVVTGSHENHAILLKEPTIKFHVAGTLDEIFNFQLQFQESVGKRETISSIFNQLYAYFAI